MAPKKKAVEESERRRRCGKQNRVVDEAELERRRALRWARNQRYQTNLKNRNGGDPQTSLTAHGTAHDGTAANPPTDARETQLHTAPTEAPGAQGASHTLPNRVWVAAGETRQAFLSRPRQPIPNGLTPHVHLSAELSKLNKALYDWGFLSVSHLELKDLVRDEVQNASQNPETLAAFIDEKERWMEEGDRILSMMEDALCGQLLFMLPDDVLRMEWQNISSVAFRVQYMIATVEAHIDRLDPVPPPY